jgi:hypothetical protein
MSSGVIGIIYPFSKEGQLIIAVCTIHLTPASFKAASLSVE